MILTMIKLTIMMKAIDDGEDKCINQIGVNTNLIDAHLGMFSSEPYKQCPKLLYAFLKITSLNLVSRVNW